MQLFSDADKLEEVERIIRSMKAFKMPYRDRRELQVMIAIAEDIRARLPDRPPAVQATLERLLAECERSKTRLGYSQHALIDLANHVIGLWPELRAALIETATKGELTCKREPTAG